MFCPYCGKQVSDDGKFCGNCGKKLIQGISDIGTDETGARRIQIYEEEKRSEGKFCKKNDSDNRFVKKAEKFAGLNNTALYLLAGFAGVLIVFAAAFAVFGGLRSGLSKSQTIASTTSQTSSQDLYENINDDVAQAFSVSKQMSGREFVITRDGTIYFDADLIGYAYAYYNQPIEAVYASNSASYILAVMEDGSVYDGETLLLEDVSVRDVCWKTHDTNINAYILTDDGTLYLYDTTEDDEEEKIALVTSLDDENEIGKVTAICRVGSYLVAFEESGSVECEISFDGIGRSGWNDVVQAACAYNKQDGLIGSSECAVTTLAAITKDGTVLAEGEYAEDILAMGDLSYIAMTDTASLIVGLKTDGTLALAGSEADSYSWLTELTDVAGIRLFGEQIKAFPYVINGDGELICYDCSYYLDLEGDFYKITDEGTESTDWVNAAEYEVYKEEQAVQTEGKEEAASGTCGDDAVWTLYDDGQLRISGTSAMKSYYYEDIMAPWLSYKSRITSVVIESGITSVSSCGFIYCEQLESVEIADSVTRIGKSAFAYCTALSEVELPDSITKIESSAFSNCDVLTKVVLPEGITKIESNMFLDCGSLTSITIPGGVTEIEDAAFYYCHDVTDIYYAGSEEDWEDIDIGNENGCLEGASIHYNAQ